MGSSSNMGRSRLQVHFDVHQPIELVEFTMAMQSLAHEYQSFVADKNGVKPSPANKDAARLYITRIENNCILAELAQASMFMGQMIHSMDQVNIFVDFTKNIKHAVEFFVGVSKRGNVDANDIPYSKRQMKRLNALT
ncbi:MAG: hypothetical protein RLP02_32460, partial [Coleofasciculus sp. C2-GNP5-27]